MFSWVTVREPVYHYRLPSTTGRVGWHRGNCVVTILAIHVGARETMSNYLVTKPSGNAETRASGSVRERILAAAADELSRWGFAGARVDRIARLARANKRMIYHYFGDKQGLRQAVLEQRLNGARTPSGGWVAPLDAVSARLVLWTLLEEGTTGLGAYGLDAGGLQAAMQGALAPGETGTRASGKPRVRLKPDRR